MQLIKLLFKPSALITSKLGNITKFSSMAMNDCSTKLDHKINLVVPSLEELKSVLHDSMVKNYESVSIDIVDCPNLRESPFRMTGSGIGNNLRIAEVGGIPNLYPHGTKKIFNLKKVCETCELPEAFVFGPGAGPFDAIGHSSELVADANLIKSQFKIANKVSWIVSSANGYTMSTTDSTDFEITANLAISDGCANRKVLKICATKRIGELGYAESIQQAIESYYGKNHQLVSLAGLFLLHKGDVYMHILPDYPVSPRKQDEKKDDWLQYMRYFTMKSPMVFTSVVHSHDNDGYKLRVEHTHGYNECNKSGGHYHIDTTPEIAQYEGYFAPAHFIYRIGGNNSPTMEDFSMKLDAKIVLNEVPSLDQLKEILQNELKSNFDYVNVDVVDCPDFRESPFEMTGSGFGKDVRIAEVGGHQNLYPVPRTDKFFNLKKIAETCEMPNAFIFGPGAGPFHVIGQNCEMVANANFNTSKDNVSTKITKIKSDNGEADQNKCNYESQTINNADFALMANLAVTDDCTSRGNKVLRINVRKRIGAMNYVEAIRKALIKHNPNKLISLAGVFLVKSGQVRMHVMPKFPEQPFKSSEQLETEWLQFFPMSSPLVCTSVIHADEKSCTEHKLRAEHTHCYSNHGDGGHYHYDITEDIIEYDGYFTTANTIYRIDMN